METKSLLIEKNLESKKQKKIDKLLDLFYSIINNDHYRSEFSLLMDKFNIFEDELAKAFLTYNLDIFAFDNSIFDSIENRFVLYIHNLIKGSWHQERQATIVDILGKLRPQSIIDLGFGIPSRYVQELGIQQKLFNVTLCDYCDSALTFAEALLGIWDDKWRTTISLKKFDMNQAELARAYDVYLFQDSIEHVADPTTCLKKYVATTPPQANFIFSLPIGDIIPAHYIEWLSDADAINWLESCGLKVIMQKLVYVNLNVDLFAESLGSNHHNLIVLAEKTQNNSIKFDDSRVEVNEDPHKLKKQQLLQIANSVLENPKYSAEIQLLMQQLQLTKTEILDCYLKYNLDIFAFDNEIYDSLAIRFVLHIQNVLEHSWNQERQKTVAEFLSATDSKRVADLGFGEPGLYLKEAVQHRKTKVTLCDISEWAFMFAERLLSLWDRNWREVVSFKQMDMNTQEFIGDFDAYLFLDSIEHIYEPTQFLTKYVQRSSMNAYFILSLPIAPMFPMHYITWEHPDEAEVWLDKVGLSIISSKMIFPNRKVDLFADKLPLMCGNFIVLCRKKTGETGGVS